MKILDSNLWVFGTLRTNERAVELLDAIDRGETTSAISAYIVQEALAAFERTQSLSPADRDAAQTQFLTRLSRMTGLIEAPSSRDVAESLLDERRSATHTPTARTGPRNSTEGRPHRGARVRPLRPGANDSHERCGVLDVRSGGPQSPRHVGRAGRVSGR